MKKFLTMLLLVAMPMAMVLTSCKDDDKEDDNTEKTAAQIVAGSYATKLSGTLTLAAEGSEPTQMTETDATITLTTIAGKDDVVSLKLVGFKYNVAIGESTLPINIPVNIAEVKVQKVTNGKATIIDEVTFTVNVALTKLNATGKLNGTVEGKTLTLALDLEIPDMLIGALKIEGSK